MSMSYEYEYEYGMRVCMSMSAVFFDKPKVETGGRKLLGK
jgi:hypothetical protein